jgi:predicted DNA-binding antitoxin AbrB/MazE fold protein
MPDITVVYEAGILRPTSPIVFPEGQTLQIRIFAPEETSQSAINPETELLNKIHHPLPSELYQRLTTLPQLIKDLRLKPIEYV